MFLFNFWNLLTCFKFEYLIQTMKYEKYYIIFLKKIRFLLLGENGMVTTSIFHITVLPKTAKLAITLWRKHSICKIIDYITDLHKDLSPTFWEIFYLSNYFTDLNQISCLAYYWYPLGFSLGIHFLNRAITNVILNSH